MTRRRRSIFLVLSRLWRLDLGPSRGRINRSHYGSGSGVSWAYKRQWSRKRRRS